MIAYVGKIIPMELPPFKLERYFAKFEFSVKYLLSSSDCDGLSQSELLGLADSEARLLWENLTLGYTESLGHPVLRQEVARLYKGLKPEQVLISTPEEGIFIAMHTLLLKGDHVICTFPGYQSLYEIARSIGCEVTEWQPEEAKGWRFDPELLRQQIKPNTKLLIVNFPHNPTGYLPTKEDFLEIIDVARKHNLYVFSDEMYRLLELHPGDRLPSACEIYEKAVVLFGMSKTFGMAGARIGWMVTQDQSLYAQMAAFKDYTTICSSAPSEILAIIALRAKEHIIQRHLHRINRNLELLDGFFARQTHLLSWTRPKAGTIAFPKLRERLSSAAFCQKMVEEAGILLLPSTIYDFDDRHFRIGFGRENMPQALGKLEAYLEKSFTPG